MSTEPDTLSYADAGVSIDAGNALVKQIGPIVARTHGPGVLGGLGGFGALFELPLADYENPVLVSGTDGVGTKLKLATLMNRHDTIGIDLVAMCVNDILVCGARPLYFLDYFATGQLDVDQARAVIEGIAQGCLLAGCSLTGGETAEMPGIYRPGDYDLAGFAVGIVDKARILQPANVRPGDVILGLASSGFHSNGYSLVRKLLEADGESLDSPCGEVTLGDALLEPTRIYVQSLQPLLKRSLATAISHITGGGLLENIPRVLPDGVQARIDTSTWRAPPVFDWVRRSRRVSEEEMRRSFNNGIGLVVITRAAGADEARTLLEDAGETVSVIGEIVAASGPAAVDFVG